MTDWKAIAAAVHAPIRDDDTAVIANLDILESSFRPLQDAIPFGTPPWTGPGDLE
ncbi:MAG: hypothetical protein JO307_13625 [Bryobacterales bacterium]|nr:hypothetical protein [Bryobacterales bacterium]MBV9398666.1 hypothetical protein [Bryobacterales bacterium]